MMLFRTIKNAVINDILGPAEAGRFRTVGFQRQVKAAEDALDFLRLVQVFYSSGNFPSSKSSPTTPQHDIQYSIELTVSKASSGDLSIINNSASTPEQVAAAIANYQEAAARADDSLDELFEIVYQILMDGRNLDLGQPVGTITKRWVDQINKDDPEPRGEYVILTGSMRLTCSVAEEISGDIGVPGDKIYDLGLELPPDETQKTGLSGKLGGDT